MVLDLEGLDVDARLVLLLDCVNDGLDDQVGDMIHMPAALDGCDGVDKTHLLEALVRYTDSNLPPGGQGSVSRFWLTS